MISFSNHARELDREVASEKLHTKHKQRGHTDHLTTSIFTNRFRSVFHTRIRTELRQRARNTRNTHLVFLKHATNRVGDVVVGRDPFDLSCAVEAVTHRKHVGKTRVDGEIFAKTFGERIHDRRVVEN